MIIPILGKPTGTRGVSLARFVGDTYGERLRIIKAPLMGKLGGRGPAPNGSNVVKAMSLTTHDWEWFIPPIKIVMMIFGGWCVN